MKTNTKSNTYYGFSAANNSEEPAWFYTAAAALVIDGSWPISVDLQLATDQRALTIQDHRNHRRPVVR
jgi:hypothetical protein